MLMINGSCRHEAYSCSFCHRHCNYTQFAMLVPFAILRLRLSLHLFQSAYTAQRPALAAAEGETIDTREGIDPIPAVEIAPI